MRIKLVQAQKRENAFTEEILALEPILKRSVKARSLIKSMFELSGDATKVVQGLLNAAASGKVTAADIAFLKDELKNESTGAYERKKSAKWTPAKIKDAAVYLYKALEKDGDFELDGWEYIEDLFSETPYDISDLLEAEADGDDYAFEILDLLHDAFVERGIEFI